ncbi:MAG TPA: flavodoxin [Candidatus Blautia gallistercoris]|uniref:Flavodoxin n=1 Tax=Candidatus Blautia gallistercoris TaxID=2838490 RepID=A0A9D1WFY6_9FIRM|nr:flavodoxin [Candidatus Blautia gallistercoris]
MKRITVLLLSLLLTVSLTACGGNESQNSQESEETAADHSASEENEAADPVPEESTENSGTNMLVAYFSYGENADLPEGVDTSSSASIQVWNGETTGNTGVVAAMIAEATGADLFSIQTVEKYPDTYDATVDQGQEEQREDARPQLASQIENLDTYDVIFLGYPNWWGDMPMAMYSFLDEVDLSGKTIVPFVTSGGSGFSSTISTIESMESGATVQEGLAISASGAASAQDQVNEWLGGLGYVTAE